MGYWLKWLDNQIIDNVIKKFTTFHEYRFHLFGATRLESTDGCLQVTELAPAGGETRSTQLQDTIATLEEEIVLGLIHPRERLVEDALISRFELKRHSIRQVLAELESMGLIERRKNVGAIVKSYTVKEVEDLYAVRILLETHCASLIPLPVTADRLEQLTALQQRHDAAVESHDLRGVFRVNIRFHQALFALSANEILVDAIRDHAQRTHPIRSSSFVQPALLEKSRREHWSILDALRVGDRATLVTLCRDHLLPSRDNYIDALRQKTQSLRR